MPIDPRIALSVNPPPGPADFLNVQDLQYRNQLARMQLGQAEQQGQSRNALAGILRNPASFQGGALTPQANAAMMAVDPMTAMDVRNRLLDSSTREMQLTEAQRKDIFQRMYPTLESTLNRYYDALQSGVPRETAMQQAQAYYDEQTGEIAKSGEIDPFHMQRIQSGRFDPYRFQALIAQGIGLKAGGETPKTRNRIEGNKEVQEQWDPIRRQWTPIGEGPRFAKTVAGPESEKYGNPVEVETVIDGKPQQLLAQQNKRTGQWVTADERRTPIEANGMRVVKQADMGGREAVLLQRGITSALDATSDIENMSALPLKASTGVFGMGHEVASPSMLDAPKRALLNKLTPQEDQQAQVAIKGIGRALAGLATGGVYVNHTIMQQYDMLAPQPGDTQLTKMQKLATMRQNADNGIEAMESNPRLGKEQKTQLDEIKNRLKRAIPYTPMDVIRYGQEGRDNETFRDFAARALKKNVSVAKGQGIESQVKAAGWVYEPDKYEYRMQNGKVQRKPKSGRSALPPTTGTVDTAQTGVGSTALTTQLRNQYGKYNTDTQMNGGVADDWDTWLAKQGYKLDSRLLVIPKTGTSG